MRETLEGLDFIVYYASDKRICTICKKDITAREFYCANVYGNSKMHLACNKIEVL